MKEYNVIDCHCHIYPERLTEKAVKGIVDFYDNRYSAFDGTLETMLSKGRAAGVKKYVVFSVATSPKQVSSINHFIADLVKEHEGIFIGLGTMHPASETPEADFEELCALGLKGVKLHPDIQMTPVDDERYKKIYRLCAGKKTVLLHTGDYRYDYSNPERVKAVLDEFPNCTFVGAHFGGWSCWEKAAQMLHAYPNFYVDTSSSFGDITPERAAALIEKYTADKVIFGTDYPLGDSEKELKYLLNVVKDEEKRKKILFENALKVFR